MCDVRVCCLLVYLVLRLHCFTNAVPTSANNFCLCRFLFDRQTFVLTTCLSFYLTKISNIFLIIKICVRFMETTTSLFVNGAESVPRHRPTIYICIYIHSSINDFSMKNQSSANDQNNLIVKWHTLTQEIPWRCNLIKDILHFPCNILTFRWKIFNHISWRIFNNFQWWSANKAIDKEDKRWTFSDGIKTLVKKFCSCWPSQKYTDNFMHRLYNKST